MSSNPRHFAHLLVGSDSVIMSSLAANHPGFRSRGFASSPAGHAGVGLPSLGNTNMKFNSSRWTRSAAEADGLSIFDMKGAMDAIQQGPDDAAKKRAHPAALAHAARVARAQQMAATLWGFKLFPDLTPGRAFMWGTILAVWAVGTTTAITARALDIQSVDDIKVKMQGAFAPYKEAMKSSAGATRGRLEPTEAPPALKDLQEFGQGLRRVLST